MTLLILYGIAVLVALIVVSAAYLWWQSSIKPAPYDIMFEVREGEAARVSRATSGWIVTATNQAKPTAIRAGTSPESLAHSYSRTLTPAVGGYYAAEELHHLKRYFFEIDFEDGRTLQTAEREIPLTGPVNFRDLGGYETVDGRRTAWGKVYRADELNRLTDDDTAIIRDLGIRLFCDLRTPSEVEDRPDRVPDGITYRHLPVFAKNPIGPLRLLFVRHRLDPAFKRLYRCSIIDEGAPMLGEVLRLTADPANLPAVLHCTSGKDRTGIASALLLHICGVPRETIVVDYSLTNLSVEKFLGVLREVLSTAAKPPPGLKIEQFYPLLSARPELIELAFAHIEATYRSVDGYLRGPVGLTDEHMEAIRRNLLIQG